MKRNDEEEAKKAKKRQQDRERQRRQRERNRNKTKQEKESKKAAGSKKSRGVKKAAKEFDALVGEFMESEDSEDSERDLSQIKPSTVDEKWTAEVMESEDSEDSEHEPSEKKPRTADERRIASKLAVQKHRAKNKIQEEKKRQQQGLPVQPSVMSRVKVVAKEKAKREKKDKKFYVSHSEQKKLKSKERHEENKEADNQRMKDYYLLNRDQINERRRNAYDAEKNKKHFPNFERDIDEAREVLADLTGFDYWKLPGEVTDEQFIQQLEDRIVTPADTNPCIAKVVNEIHLNVPVYDCACCGRKELGTLSSRFKEKGAKNKKDSGRIVDLNNPHDRDFIRALEVRETNEEVLSVKGTKKMRPTAPYALFYRV